MVTGGILALDLATVAGWAYGPATPPQLPLGARAEGGYAQPASGSFRVGPKGCGDGVFFASFQQWLEARLMAWRPSMVVWEAPIIGTPGKINRNTVYRLTGLAVIADLTCHENRISETAEVPLATIKKYATGSGRADKKAMQDAALLMGWAFGDDNEVDALWLHSYASAIVWQRNSPPREVA